jgi:hypothetical protein
MSTCIICCVAHICELVFVSYIYIYSYRTREEIQDVRKSRDPITSFREKLIQANLATDDEFKVGSNRYIHVNSCPLDPIAVLRLSRILIMMLRKLLTMLKVMHKMILNCMSMNSILMFIRICRLIFKFVDVTISPTNK